jgi:GMP synthase (glutamine-hydrolysing)
MPKLLVCQHVAWEPLGTLDRKLRSSGFRIRYVNFGRDPHAKPDLDGYGGLVILGGPMNVDDVGRHPHLATEVELVQKAIDRRIPVLGICLGAQLIAKALGAAVRLADRMEIGWHDIALTEAGRADPVLGHVGTPTRLFQWHEDVFDLPPGATHLATSERCAYQAFRYGADVYAFQFHLEVDEPLIDRWLGVPTHLRQIESLGGELDANRIRRETRERIAMHHEIADRALGEVVRILGADGPRGRVLPSR